MKSKQNNKRMKRSNGNIKNQNIKIMHWNGGNAQLVNQLVEVETLINLHKPDIFCLNEANIRCNTELGSISLPNYNVEMDRMIETFGVARVAIFIKKKLVYKRMTSNKLNDFPIVSIRVCHPNQKRFELNAIYRQWRQVNINSNLSHKLNTFEQREQFDRLMEKVVCKDDSTECILIGDFNFDSALFSKNLDKWSKHERGLSEIVKKADECLIQNGFSQMVTFTTHDQSTLDHFYTNNVSKIESIKKIEEITSDHYAFIVYRKMKINQAEEALMTIRDFSKVNKSELIHKIRNHPKYFNALISKEVNSPAED